MVILKNLVNPVYMYSQRSSRDTIYKMYKIYKIRSEYGSEDLPCQATTAA